MASNKSNVPNIYAYRGRHLLSQHHARHEDIPDHELSEMKEALHNHAPTSDSPVCIIGAGMAGLYTAMIFESLKIPYQIVDADTRERVGGRIFTYHFPDSGPYDYFDVGAMRFPDTPFMKRTFDLARNRGLPVNLIPYITQMVEPSPNTFLFYNNARVNNGAPSIIDNPFNVDHINDPSLRTPEGVFQRVAEVLRPFRGLFRVEPGDPPLDVAKAMKDLYKWTDRLSMRSCMSTVFGMSAKDISWCETLDKSTGSYDQALTEIIIGSLASNWPDKPPSQDPNTDWYCFDGGSSTLPEAMFNSLSQVVREATQFRSPITAISEDTENNCMNVSINGIKSSTSYPAIISTVPLPCLSLMDLTGANVTSGQRSAIRELQYEPAVKVGIRFSCPWWETKLQPPIHGGRSHTDLPLRTIVYPSYPEGVTPDKMSKVLIVSYSSTQDAQRLGAFINADGTAQPKLIELVFRDLAAVHGMKIEELWNHYKPGDCFAWDWSRNPFSMGGYAHFGPGAYDVYSEMILPAANGKLFFAGEATSDCHGWVSSALNSAWRAVDQYLTLNQPQSVRQEFWKLWGPTEYWDGTSDRVLVDLGRKPTDGHHGDLELVNLDRRLADRHLVIGLHGSGIRPSRKEST
ncbi:hypothetical protein BDM02DRAFT_2079180 [Thelephora ganbajun]|uniref:Uncharacterized protein n=1 Tax=Thelephora ganbajun TaxID=370292 RepID=A0ACB6ZGY8_THEGA|nr:hypothetical protein BDM02DRAFT_2079180 [Thelephora ganbajun]